MAVVAGCATGGSRAGSDGLLSIAAPDRVVLAVHQIPGFGAVLVDGQGRSLYMFPPDAGGQVRCSGACAGTWPPLVITNGHRPTITSGVNAQAVGALRDPNTGQQVVTYGGYPLYTYAGDLHPGQTNGQGLFLDAGPWYLLSPDGDPITSNRAGS